MNITFIEPQSSKYSIFTSHSNFEPLGLEYIAAVAGRNGHKVNILRQENESRNSFLKKIFNTQPNIVAFTAMTHSHPFAVKIAKQIKDKDKNIITIFGGIHVTSIPESVADKSIDFIVLGEGEYSFLELVKIIESNNDPSNVRGIAYKNKRGEIKINKRRKRIENLDELPFPYRSIEILSKTNINTIMDPPRSRQKAVAQVLYSRGCIYNCAFCASKNIWGHNIVWRSAKNVADEIEELKEEYKTNAIFFADLTFNSNHKKVLELCTELISRKIDVKWYAMLRLVTPSGERLVSKDLLKSMKDAGCAKVSYGLESLTADEGDYEEGYKKFGNLKTLKQVLEYGNDLGLIQRGYLIIGHPSDTKESMELTKERLIELPLDDTRISFLVPFPGTSIYDKYKSEGIITTDDWKRYTENEPIIKSTKFSIEQLIKIRTELLLTFFNNPEYKKRIESKIKKFPNLKDGFSEFFAELNKKINFYENED